MALDGESQAGEGENPVQAETLRERPTVEMLRQEMVEFERYLVNIDPTPDNFNVVFDRAEQLYVRFYAGLYDERGEIYSETTEVISRFIVEWLEELRAFLFFLRLPSPDTEAEATTSYLHTLFLSCASLDIANLSHVTEIRGNPFRLLAHVLMGRLNRREKRDVFLFGEPLRQQVVVEWQTTLGDDKMLQTVLAMRERVLRAKGLSGDNVILEALQRFVFERLDRGDLLAPHCSDLINVLLAEATRDVSFEAMNFGLRLLAWLARPGDGGVRLEEEGHGDVFSRTRMVSSALKRQLHEIFRESRQDPLTGLLNRKAWDENAQAPELQRRAQTVFLIDLNGFKFMNDAIEAYGVLNFCNNHLGGHLLGDLVLREIGQAFLYSSREHETYYRYGGDEIVVVIPGHLFMSEVIAFSRRLNQMLQNIGDRLDLKFSFDFTKDGLSYTKGESVPLSAAIAAAHYFPEGDTCHPLPEGCARLSLREMIEPLDQLLYQAKRDEGNQMRPLKDRAAVVLGRTITKDGTQRIPLRD